MKAQGSITAVVVSRGLEGMLRFCLDGLRRALEGAGSPKSHGMVLVDNASPFPYREGGYDFPKMLLLRLDTHHSFARANNMAAARMPNDYFLFVNNDVLLDAEVLSGMREVLDSSPDAGICGARLLFPDGTIQHGGVVFGPGDEGPRHADRERPASLVPMITREYQAVTGACMMVRASTWQELGGFDETFPFGLEDIDFCLRARQRGWRVFCYHERDSLHFESMTPGRHALDVPSRRHFMERWSDRYTIDS